MQTDAEGFYVFKIWPDSEYAAAITAARWDVDVGGNGYGEDDWRYADGLFELPSPLVNETARTLAFGDVKIGATFLEVAFTLSKAAQGIVSKAEPDDVLECRLELDGGPQLTVGFELRTDRVSLVPLLPGLYSLTAKFGFRLGLPAGEAVIGPTLPVEWDDDDWERVSDSINLLSGERHRLKLNVEPLPPVRVFVETPAGRAEKADFTLEVIQDGQDSGEEAGVRDAPRLNVRIQPGHWAKVTGRVDGYEPVSATVPKSGELVLRAAVADVSATLDVSWDDDDTDAWLVLRATNGELVCNGKLRSPARVRVPAGSYELDLTAVEKPRGCKPVEINLRAGEHRHVAMPQFDQSRPKPDSTYIAAYCGEDEVDGVAFGVEPNGGQRLTKFGVGSRGRPRMVDGADILEPEPEAAGADEWVLRLPVRMRVSVPDPYWGVECFFDDGGTCHGRGYGLVKTLWAPPGPCRIVASSGSYSVFEWTVELRAELIVDVAVPIGAATVHFNFEQAALTAEQVRERAVIPHWLLIRKENGKERLVHKLQYDDDVELVSGDYLLRAAFGPDKKRAIAFTVVDGQKMEVQVPAAAAVKCDGCVLLELPEGWNGRWFLDIDWRPEFFGEDWRACARPDAPELRYRIVDGKLRIENLPVGEPLVLRLEFSTEKPGATQVWKARLESVSIENAQPKMLETTWVEQK